MARKAKKKIYEGPEFDIKELIPPKDLPKIDAPKKPKKTKMKMRAPMMKLKKKQGKK